MSEKQHFKFSLELLFVPMVAVLLIWIVFWVEVNFSVNFNKHGIYPRSFRGLQGILFSPFIHGSVTHLYNNTIPLAILSLALFFFYRQSAWQVFLLGWLLSGVLTWLIGRESYHIGASGIIYVLASFIFFKGIFARHYRLVALSLAVIFLYGGLIWYIFPIKDGISWEGHLSGFLSGLFLAAITKTTVPKEPKYSWQHEDYKEEDDEFMKHFDEDGNFIEKPHVDELKDIRITYKYKKNQDNN